MRRRLALLVLLAGPANAQEVDLQAWIGGDAITNGRDTVQIGLTVEWKYAELDISHGIQNVPYRVPAEPEWKMDEWQSGSVLALRVYPFRTETFRPLLVWNHASDITRGRPFNDENEPTSDFFGVGLTVEVQRFELDIAYGTYGRECRVIECADGSRTNELQIAFRGYFWK